MPVPPAKSKQRRALMATSGGRLALVPFQPRDPSQADDPPVDSLGQYLAREKTRERLRVALARRAAHLPPIRIG